MHISFNVSIENVDSLNFNSIPVTNVNLNLVFVQFLTINNEICFLIGSLTETYTEQVFDSFHFFSFLEPVLMPVPVNLYSLHKS